MFWILVACAGVQTAVVTDIRGKQVDPNTLMCKSIGEIADFSGGNAILSKQRTKRIKGEDILAAAKDMGATHIRWTDYGRRGTAVEQSGEAYRCVFHTKEFKKSFAANVGVE